MANLTLWLREEARTTERRTPLLPNGAKELVDAGINVVVETSEKRIIDNALYEQAGCTMAKPGDWEKAPSDAIILGLKELPETPTSLAHTHIYFGHVYKEQQGWQDLLLRFQRGGGSLLDIEYMTDTNGRRVVAFGYWAGYMGAALALLQWYDRKAGRTSYINGGLSPFESAKALDDLIEEHRARMDAPTALVIGAGGRSGIGSAEILERHGVKVTRWGRKETADLDRQAILDHDILINCAFIDDMIPAFLKPEHISDDSRLKVISDVSCDPKSSFNPLPLYGAPTCWKTPAIPARTKAGDVDLIAIDNLPSLLPTESSIEFAAMMLPHLKNLPHWKEDSVWMASDSAFQQACNSMIQSEAS